MTVVGQARTSPESMLQNIYLQLVRSQPQLLLSAGWFDYSPLREIYLQVAERRSMGGTDGPYHETDHRDDGSSLGGDRVGDSRPE